MRSGAGDRRRVGLGGGGGPWGELRAHFSVIAGNPAIAAWNVGESFSKVKLDKLELFHARAGYGYGSQYMGRYHHRTPAHSLGVGN